MKVKHKQNGPQAQHKEVALSIHEPWVLQSLVGEQDSNIKLIERELDIDIGRDADKLVIRGQDSDVDLAHDLISQLKNLLEKGETLFPGDLERSLKLLAGNRKLQLQDLFRDQIKIAGRKYSIVPKTPRQSAYIESIQRYDMVFGVGPAGTGKTYLAMAMAVSALLKKDVKRVILCRPAVEAGEKLGFLPGDMAEKVNPYLRPLYDALYDMVDFDRANEMVEKGVVEVAPLAFMRGRTLSDAFVILDEAQNTTPMQMKMFLTRIGFGSKCVITGDITQIDLPRGTVSGLTDALRILKGVDGLSIMYFNEEDVIRHPLVSRVVAAYRDKGTSDN